MGKFKLVICASNYLLWLVWVSSYLIPCSKHLEGHCGFLVFYRWCPLIWLRFVAMLQHTWDMDMTSIGYMHMQNFVSMSWPHLSQGTVGGVMLWSNGNGGIALCKQLNGYRGREWDEREEKLVCR